MKTLKLYQSPEMMVVSIEVVDLITASDNDVEWNDNWNDEFFI